MAAGDITLFHSLFQDLGRGVHNLETATIRIGLITDAVSPTAADATASWGDYSTNEVTPGGNYSAGGPDISGTYSQTAGTATFDATDVSIAADAGNPTDARWGIIYNDSAAGNEAIGYLDLGSVIDLSASDLGITWNASGIFTIA